MFAFGYLCASYWHWWVCNFTEKNFNINYEKISYTWTFLANSDKCVWFDAVLGIDNWSSFMHWIGIGGWPLRWLCRTCWTYIFSNGAWNKSGTSNSNSKSYCAGRSVWRFFNVVGRFNVSRFGSIHLSSIFQGNLLMQHSTNAAFFPRQIYFPKMS